MHAAKCLNTPATRLGQLFRALHNLGRGSAQCARLHSDLGRMQAIGSPDFAEIVRRCRPAFGDDQDAVAASAPPLLAFEMFFLPLPWGRYQAPLRHYRKAGLQKWDAAVAPHEAAALKRLVFARTEFRQADQRRCLVIRLPDKPTLIAPE